MWPFTSPPVREPGEHPRDFQERKAKEEKQNAERQERHREMAGLISKSAGERADGLKARGIFKNAVVRIRSGGPSMTVVDINIYVFGGFMVSPGDKVDCIWFDASGRKLEGSFPDDALVAVENAEGSPDAT